MIRRRIALGFIGSAFLPVPAAWAHHGFTGQYDFDRPLMVDGKLTARLYANPHAQMTVQVDVQAVLDVAGLQAVETSEGRATLALLKRVSTGSHKVLFDPPTTRVLMEHTQAPKIGDRVRVIAYRRISNDSQLGELRALHVAFPGGEVLTGQRRSYHRSRQ